MIQVKDINNNLHATLRFTDENQALPKRLWKFLMLTVENKMTEADYGDADLNKMSIVLVLRVLSTDNKSVVYTGSKR